MQTRGDSSTGTMLPVTQLIPAAASELVNFRAFCDGISQTDAVNALLNLGGAFAAYGRSSTVYYRENGSDTLYRIRVVNGAGRVILR